MKSFLIQLNRTDLEIFTDCTGDIIIEISGEGSSENISESRIISKETLKSYIDSLQEIYEGL